MVYSNSRIAPIPSTTLVSRKPSYAGIVSNSNYIKCQVLNENQQKLQTVYPILQPNHDSNHSIESTTRTKKIENVKVAVRCRPLSSRDTNTMAWHIDPTRAKIQLTDAAATARRPQQQQQNKEYYFDHIAYGSDNNALYQSSIKPLIGQAMDGYNATVFAYGQTASGKTYTMMGTEQEPGIIPRAVEEIFSYIKTAIDQEFLLRVSYLEIYNETIRDLLAPENDNLKVHEHKKRGIYVTPMKEEVVTCSQDVLNMIQRGETNRHISTTDYNLHSSRSHTIFQMVIESRQRSRENTSRTLLYPTKSVKESVKISQLNLIDLAGSEKAASNHDRRKEGAYINKSLLTLGTVISKLTESGKSSSHVPYRDSKLTRILQPSLSGHAKVVVICTMSPHSVAVDETINTLKFATRVKKVVLSAKNDAVMDDKALLQQYRGEITELKMKLKTASDVLVEEQQSKQSMITAERQQFEEELSQMRLVRNALKERIDHLTKMILTSTPPIIEDITNTMDDPSINDDSDMTVTKHQEDTTKNPWELVRRLQHENQELRQTNKQLQKQLTMYQHPLE